MNDRRREQARTISRRNGHSLGIWRQTGQGYTATCRRCSIEIHITEAHPIALSDIKGLQTPCSE